MSFPKVINFRYDDTQMELQKTVTENKIIYGVYRYTKAKVFLGMELKFTQDKIDELKRKEIITCH